MCSSDLCPIGYISNSVGATECFPCECGTQPANPNDEGNRKCLPCPSGSITVDGRCHECDCWKRPDLDICECVPELPCPPGSQRGEETGDCVPCPPGSYSPGDVACAPCPPGTVGPVSGMVECQLCPCGQEPDEPDEAGNTVCRNCPANSISDADGNCEFCPGWTIANTKICECVPAQDCPKGQVPTDVAGVCEPCPAGTYHSGDDCLACPPGTIQDQAGQCECEYCPCGTEPATDGSGNTECVPCPENSITNAQGFCDYCEGWYQANTDTCECEPAILCPCGTEPGDEVGICNLCTPGSYNAVEGGDCLPCPVGTYTPAFGAKVCQPCPCGSEPANASSTGNSACDNCDNDRDITGDNGLCFECPEGTFPDRGICECTEVEDCVDGQTQDPVSGICTPCPCGTFSIAGGECFPCPVGTYAPVSASGQCSACPCGQQPATNGEGNCQCVDCPSNSVTGPDGFCRPCKGWTVPDTTTCECVPEQDCPDGHEPTNVVGVCRPCPCGQYSTGGADCRPCPVGEYAPSTGSSYCSACPCGHEPKTTGKGNCKCQACPPFHITGDDGFCEPCGYWELAFLPECECREAPPCGPGEEPDNTPGICQPCLPGQYSDDNDECEPCPTGTYAPGPRAQECLPCPCGSEPVTTGEGNRSCRPCGPNSITGEDGFCQPCKGWTVANQKRCECVPAEDCPPGSEPTSTPPNCKPCQPGEYSEDGEDCLPCPPGTYSIRWEPRHASRVLAAQRHPMAVTVTRLVKRVSTTRSPMMASAKNAVHGPMPA